MIRERKANLLSPSIWILSLLTLGLLYTLLGCKTTLIVNQADFKIKNDSINLYAFIGEKISIQEFHLQSTEETVFDSITGDSVTYVNLVMDHAFRAKYKVRKNVFNELPSDTINFIAFDHYGKPPFRKPRYVLLYLELNESDSAFYHHKYQFDPLKKVGRDKWKGQNNESIKELFNTKKNGTLARRGVFN
ncbi:hypothetical protein MTsPCn9_25290 [Croceitalea sp. MTPC9]|uniref:hypothetical protein n=1 Tax=unclassified Croceitalea TaxID=2632280 RepID=UPI002B3B4B5C|nr:hypothetical protein MTsPCn6_29240 [Croceitalea sp. MTPC6]GMN17591.1 hypothetical protein MTsPCn9_25290 [Croceitalea sp. MTPC9]